MWRSMIVAPAGRFIKIDKTMNVDLAATLAVNPTTAYRMMKDFINLQPGQLYSGTPLHPEIRTPH